MAEKSQLISVDLRPDRKLIDSNFDSYKLSLNPLPCFKAKVIDGVYRVVAGEDDFGYEKIRCLTLHNHLVLDPWNKENVYYVDCNGCIRRFHIPLETHIEPPKIVFSLGSEMAVAKKKLPPSLYFPSPTMCVACDGLGSLFVLDTGLRNEWHMDLWKILYFDEVSRSPCMVLHAIHRKNKVEDANVDYVDGIFIKFENKKVQVGGDSETFVEVVLEWSSIEKKSSEDEYIVSSLKTFRGKSVPNYVALSSDCSELHIASSSPFKFLPAWNSEFSKEIEDLESENEDSEGGSAVDLPPAPYRWKQSPEDITLYIDLPSKATATSVIYSLNSKHLTVAIRDEDLAEPRDILNGDLFLDADPEASNWTISNGQLEVTIQKRIEGRTWLTVLDGDNRGELLVDPEEAANVHEKLAHLTSESLIDAEGGGTLFNAGQLEDCDAYYDSTATLMRFDASNEKFTHVADISSLRWLFNVNCAPTEFPAIVLRHDVDAVAWQPTETIFSKDKRVLWKHVATFNALGYVHASKTNLKYCASPPDSSFAAFSECQRRLYVYRQPTPLTTSLRNRTSGTVVGKIAIQQVATIDGNDDILGFAVSCERMYVLTANDLVVFKVLVDDGA